MKIELLAYDSMGVRSMATLIETKDIRLMIDPGVALAPYRYGLPPHELEIKKLNEMWSVIEDNLIDCTHVVITHYHYDHHEPDSAELLAKKMVYVKHPTQNINFSQKRRASYFLSKINEAGGTYQYADGRDIRVNSTIIRISEPIPHGTNTKLGYVIMVSVCDGEEKVLYTSDVEGPSLDAQLDIILRERSDVLIVDGPMTYMLGYRYPYESLEASIKNLIRIIRETPVKTIVLDHHLMRDLGYKQKIEPVIREAELKGVRLLSAAEFEGKPIEMLEARRKELYGSSCYELDVA
ncbi:MAG: MBL fold metallo-hydrolase [Candidatus Nezhaarchaeota archaeon]|nr:MBL fold metallo-hydrolase [Candidatus Nezhaarchaeota archaeon]